MAQPAEPEVGSVQITRSQRNAVAERVTQLERAFYGRGPSNVKVSVSEEDPISLVVLSIDSLTAADSVLSQRGYREAVLHHHEALHEATMDDFVEAVEQVVQARVHAYLAQVHPTTGHAVRVFILADLGDSIELERATDG